MTQTLTLTRPDDWHLHLRDGAAMAAVVGDSARQFGRAIVMPNLVPPVTTVEMALQYRERILQQLPEESTFQPLMTLYLTDQTLPSEIEKAANSEQIQAVKLYPAGATTNSDSGVTDLEKIQPTLQAMAECGLPLLVHGEVTSPEVDLFDREARFIEEKLAPMLELTPEIRLVFEHITTKQGVDFVKQSPETIAATITAHHLLMNRNALFQGGIRPHHYCLPVLKRETHRQALLEAATSGNSKFFLGTDSAPHPRHVKESGCGCAGMYTAHAAIELYAEAFESADALDKLEPFASFNGPDFYRLPRNSETITLTKESWEIPTELPFGETPLVPFRAGEAMQWKLSD
ncbi:MAG: dihydroorotase [Gammaproteobacteria bacterium]|nr:dihydroorotase [Gammaproteobacteria bacterium]MBT4605334.1 dihydroorotase [Thiotrichales bacterium]MBT3472368.1 dihydroorotase [Gammaproteobacteria bacterium]MBT3965936.1 dihydroorotase [Gammaproteobacteria bacterium]MBT4081827.1 dihydroorotase [Gammaproteobacteria bacterium]